MSSKGSRSHHSDEILQEVDEVKGDSNKKDLKEDDELQANEIKEEDDDSRNELNKDDELKEDEPNDEKDLKDNEDVKDEDLKDKKYVQAQEDLKNKDDLKDQEETKKDEDIKTEQGILKENDLDSNADDDAKNDREVIVMDEEEPKEKISVLTKPSISLKSTFSESKSKSKSTVENSPTTTTTPETPAFICHEANFDPGMKFIASSTGRINKEAGGESSDESLNDDEFYPKPKDKRTYTVVNPKDQEYRPAALTSAPIFVNQVLAAAHAELLRHDCQRYPLEKKLLQDTFSTQGNHLKDVKRDSHLSAPHESMDRKIQRLKIYQRAFSSLVINFRAYSPVLFFIKKSFDDVVSFRLGQFKEAQNEKSKQHFDRVSLEHKMATYKFPDYQLLKKGELYIGLLLSRIKKQDEAIQFITDILTKIEQSLSDHFERNRDTEDQIKLLDQEIAERIAKSKGTSRKIQEDTDDGGTSLSLGGMGDEPMPQEEVEDEEEEINEDKLVVLMLAYSVCMKDLEEANKKIRMYENKYQHVAPRHELESLKKAITEEKNQIKVVAKTLEDLQNDLNAIKIKEMETQRELEDLRAMPEGERAAIIQKKIAAMEAAEEAFEGEEEEGSEEGYYWEEDEEEYGEEELEDETESIK